ncbi:MAG: response regulator [Chloroflexi bacterium]|nr:MAG: response regulator [Chloroflexota bacterium]
MKVRILIIDNEPRWLDFVKSDLHKFEIVVAPDTKTALAELKKDKFDLVIASSSNLEVLKTISEKYSSKRVVVTTVRPSTQEARDAYRLGALRYFPKSFSPKDLFNHVKDVIPNK